MSRARLICEAKRSVGVGEVVDEGSGEVGFGFERRGGRSSYIGLRESCYSQSAMICLETEDQWLTEGSGGASA